MATGIDNSGLYAGRREAMGIIKAIAGQITSFDVFSGIGISAATAFASAAKSSYDFEKEFHKNMLEVATISTQVEGSMTDFMNRVMAITQEIPIKAPEAAKALYQIVSAGHDGADGMHILEVSAKSAIGGMTDAATASDAITTLINAYKLSASDAEKVSDQLFTTARLGKTTFGELGQSIAQVAPIAASYGVEMDQVLAAVATLTKSGTPTAQAMTQIRASIIGASKVLGDGAFNTRTFQEGLAEIAAKAGGSESKLRELIPEVEAVNGVLGLTGIKAQDAAEHLKAMNDSTGATSAAFELMMNDVDKQMTLLSNNIQAALRPMGQAILKEVSEVATAFNEAFKNGDVERAVKSLGDLIVIVTGAFVGYKGAVTASTIAQNIHTKALVVSRLASMQHITTSTLMTNAIKAQTVALLKNVAALATNPYVLAAAAISALGYGIYKYATQASVAEKAQMRFNARIEEQKRIAEELKNRTDQLLEVIRDETKIDYERNKALKALKDLYPQIFEKYDIEALKLADILQIKKQIAELDSQRSYQSDKSKYVSLVSKRDKLDSELSYRSENYGNGQYKYGEFYDQTVSQLRKEREGVQHEIDSMYLDLQDRADEIWNRLTPKEVKIVSLEKNIKSLKEEQEQLNELVNGNKGPVLNSDSYASVPFVPSPVDVARLNFVNGLIKEQSKELDSLKQKTENNSQTEQTVYQRKIQLAKELTEAETNLNNMRSPDSKAKETEITAAENKVKEIKSKLELLTGISEKEGDKLKQAQTELSRLLLDSELKLQAGRIAAMEDGKAKRIALAEQEYRETVATIQKEKEEYQKKIKETKGKEDPTVISSFNNRETAAGEKKNTDVAKVEKEYAEEYKQRTKALTDVFLSEEQRKLSGIKDRYTQEKKWAYEQLKTGGMTQDEHKTYTVNIDKAQSQETYRSLLDNLNDYKQQEKDLREKWDTDIAAAVEAKDAYLVAKLMEGKEKALSSLNSQMLQESSEWMRLFGNLDTLTVDELNKLIDSIQKQLDSGTLTLNPVDAKALMDSLNQAKEKVAQKNPFTALAKSSGEMKTALKELDAAEKRGLTGEALDVYKNKVKNTAENVKKSITAIKGVYDQVSDVMKSAAELVGMVDEGLGETVNNAIALGDAVMNVGEVVANAVISFAAGMNAMESASVILLVIKAVLMAVMAAMALFNGDKKHEKKIKKLQEEVDSLSRAYDRLGKSIEDAYSTNKANLIDEESENLRKQNELIRQQIKEEDEKKKTDKDKIKDWQNQIEDNNYQIEENSKKNKVEAIMGSDIKSAIDEFSQAYADAWAAGNKSAGKSTNIVKNLIRTSIIEMLKDKLQPEVTAFMTFLSQAMADGVIDAAEQRTIDDWEKTLEGIADNAFAGKDKWLTDIDADDLLGISSDSMADTLIEGLKAGKSGIKDFTSSFEDMMKTAVLNSLKMKYLEGPLKEFQKKFADLSESGGQLTESEIEELRNMYSDIIDGAKEQFDAIKGISGLDFSADSDNTLKGAFSKASQESIDLLAGQTGAQRFAIENIREQMQFIRDLQVQGWKDVTTIKELVGKLREVSDKIEQTTEEIKGHTDKISENSVRAVDALENTLNVKVKL